ncbi:GWxTD domain-containing protein, partial [Candidatus Neomarinimicrobiota bacterium]
IALDYLVFLATNSGFKATYELSIFALDEEDMVRGTIVKREEVVKSRFEETQSRDFYHIVDSYFFLKPGEYRIVTNLVDLDSREQYNADKEIVIPSYSSDGLVIGDVLLVNMTESVPSDPDSIIPYIGNLVTEEADSIYIFLTVRAPIEQPSQALLNCTLMERDDTVDALQKTLQLNSSLTTHFFPVATNLLREREYTLNIRVQMDSLEVRQSTQVFIFWTGFSHLIEDVEQAIEQARFIASRADIREMNSASGEEGKREAFLAFWQTLDPTPGTPRNELMDEYYRRVAYANANFHGYRSGWETDMGMVHIIYGLPDDIERHPFDIDSKPYEIWYYYNRGWRFIFVDVNMLGEYRLASPLYPGSSF